MNWLFNVTINDISVIHVTAHRCAGGLKKKFDLRSGSQRHRHFAGFFNVPVQAPTRDQPFYMAITNPVCKECTTVARAFGPRLRKFKIFVLDHNKKYVRFRSPNQPYR